MAKVFSKECLVTVKGVEYKVTVECDYSDLSEQEILDWAASKWIIKAQDEIRLDKIKLPAADEDGNRVLSVKVKPMGTRTPADNSASINSIIATAKSMNIELSPEQAAIILKKAKEKKKSEEPSAS